MRLREFLHERLTYLGSLAVAMATVSLILSCVQVTRDLIGLVDLVLLVCSLVPLWLSYVQRKAFWQDVNLALSDPRNALAVSDLVQQPSYADGARCWEALEAVCVAGQAAAGQTRQESAEYRAYIDAWVHEIKTPLAAAKLMCEAQPEVPSRQLLRELERVDGYVEQALYYSRSGSVEHDYLIVRTTVGELVKEALRTHKRSLIDAHMAVSLGQGMDLTVHTDSKWLVFCLGQVIQNAVKYHCAADPRTGEPRTPRLSIMARMHRSGLGDETVELVVLDNGFGIPAHDVPRVFDKAFVGDNGRLPGQSRSTGLGLYLVKRLCSKMGVRVTLDSQQHEWTRLTFTFSADTTHELERNTLFGE